MFYDVHNHVGLDPACYLRGWWPYASTAQDMLGHMHDNGIDRAVVFPFTVPSACDIDAFVADGTIALKPGRVPFDRENELLIREIERIDGRKRLLVLAMFDAFREVDAQLKNLERLRGRYVGLKLQGTILQSPVAALLDAGRPLMQFAESHRLPVLIHTSIAPGDHFSQVRDCLRVAAAFPSARFNLAHSLRFHEPGLREAAQMENVWVDCSAHLAHCQLARENHAAVAAKHERVDADYSKPVEVLRAIHDLMGGRYMWGSDSPYMSWCDDDMRMVFSYRDEASVLHALPAPVKHAMATVAPEAWLGLGPRAT